MVLFDVNALLDFPRYGIAIPALDSRKIRTLEALKAEPELTGRAGDWLIEPFEDVLELADLLRIQTKEYARGFFDHRAAERLRDAFELVNPDGSYNRWDPSAARSPLEDMVPSLMHMAAGTYRAGLIAREHGFCHYLGGGAHHGHADFGHGFCPVNDVAASARRLQAEGRAGKLWIIDVDAHKGDGTAAVFAGDDTVFTLSIHMAAGWPLDGSLPAGHPSWTPSDIDVPIESGEEHQYLERLDSALVEMKSRSSADMAIVLAGSDPWERDALPSTDPLNLSFDQITARDRMVYQFLETAGVPSAWVTAGGYGEGSWKIHAAFLSWVLRRRLTEPAPADSRD